MISVAFSVRNIELIRSDTRRTFHDFLFYLLYDYLAYNIPLPHEITVMMAC